MNTLALNSEDSLSPILALRHKRDLHIIAMGDSSVFGVGDHGDAIPSVGAGWAGRLAHDLCAKRFINVAKNGARARHILSQQLNAAIAFQPNLVLICIGSNDVLRGNFSPSEIRESLIAVSKRLTASNAVVILLGLPDPIRTAPGPMSLRIILSPRVAIINEILAQLADGRQTIFVPTWNTRIADERQMWHVDRMHPSAQGHQHIADLVRRQLSLPRCSIKKIPTHFEISRNHEARWLLTNGFKWFAKRSIDLVPALIWLVVSDKFLRFKLIRR